MRLWLRPLKPGATPTEREAWIAHTAWARAWLRGGAVALLALAAVTAVDAYEVSNDGRDALAGRPQAGGPFRLLVVPDLLDPKPVHVRLLGPDGSLLAERTLPPGDIQFGLARAPNVAFTLEVTQAGQTWVREVYAPDGVRTSLTVRLTPFVFEQDPFEEPGWHGDRDPNVDAQGLQTAGLAAFGVLAAALSLALRGYWVALGSTLACAAGAWDGVAVTWSAGPLAVLALFHFTWVQSCSPHFGPSTPVPPAAAAA